MASKRQPMRSAFDTLIPDREPGKELAGARLLPIKNIVPNPRQPRQTFDEAELQTLADTIREHGVVQPIVVRPGGERDGQKIYQVVAGERRLRATGIAGKSDIPAVIHDLTDAEAAYWTAIENGQRAALDTEDRARELAFIQELTGDSDREIAEKLGYGRSYVNNHLRIIRRMPDLFEPMRRGVLTFEQALALLPFLEKNPELLAALRLGNSSWSAALAALEASKSAEISQDETLTDDTLADQVSQPETVERASLDRGVSQPETTTDETALSGNGGKPDAYTPWRRRPLESFTDWFRRVDIRMVPKVERQTVRARFSELKQDIERADAVLAQLEAEETSSAVKG